MISSASIANVEMTRSAYKWPQNQIVPAMHCTNTWRVWMWLRLRPKAFLAVRFNFIFATFFHRSFFFFGFVVLSVTDNDGLGHADAENVCAAYTLELNACYKLLTMCRRNVLKCLLCVWMCAQRVLLRSFSDAIVVDVEHIQVFKQHLT